MTDDADARNEVTHVQFRMTPRQKELMLAQAPPGMSVHQAAKWHLLKKFDRSVADDMAERASQGMKRLTV